MAGLLMYIGALVVSKHGDGESKMRSGTNKKLCVSRFEEEGTLRGEHGRPLGGDVLTAQKSKKQRNVKMKKDGGTLAGAMKYLEGVKRWASSMS